MEKPKETVLVVHGTFSGKQEGGPPNWYAPGQKFCVQLDRELEKRNSNARCWSHLQTGEDYFHWDGKNDWLSRAKTAARLRKEIRRLNSAGWLVHLIGHSHGGNVIIDAITDDVGRTQSWFNGRVALLGTPIYRSSRNYQKIRRTRLASWLALSLIAWVALVLYGAQGTNVFAAFGAGPPTETFAMLVTAASILAVAFLLASGFGVLSVAPNESNIRKSPAILAINTPYDEAYRSLSGLRDSANPFLTSGATESSIGRLHRLLRRITQAGVAIAGVTESIRSGLSARIRQTLETGSVTPMLLIGLVLILAGLFWQPVVAAAISGPLTAANLSMALLVVVSLFLFAACFSRRGFGNAIFLPGIVIANTVSVIWKAATGFVLVTFDVAVKKAAWGVIKSLSLGINGAPRRADDILVSLKPNGDHIYLELPQQIVEEIKNEQKSRLGQIQEILYRENLKWSPTQLAEQLEGIDFPMIHTIYYRNAECVQKVADWIEEPVQELLDAEIPRETVTTVGESDGIYRQIRETIRSPNVYKIHLAELQTKLSTPGSIWYKPLGRSQQALADLASSQSALATSPPPSVTRRLPPRWPPPSKNRD